jgi:hypothetical protein
MFSHLFYFGANKMLCLDHDQFQEKPHPLDPENSCWCFKIHPSLHSVVKQVNRCMLAYMEKMREKKKLLKFGADPLSLNG